MIESNLQFPSVWNSDPILNCELLPGNDGVSIFEDDPQKSTVKNECSVFSGSGCSSDLGDLTNFQDICDILPHTEESASLLAEEKSLVDSLGLSDLNWTAFSECFTEQIASQSNNINDNVLTRKAEKFEEALLDHINSTKLWSAMNTEEQLETVEALTQIINHRMKLPEQMKIISVIDPSAVITSSDKEFVIDLLILNDPKFQTIKDIVKEHFVCETTKSSDLNSGLQNSSHIPAKGKLQKKLPYKKEIDAEEMKEMKMRQRKICRQDKKEERSGLFIHERKIRKLYNPQQEEEDVNILEQELPYTNEIDAEEMKKMKMRQRKICLQDKKEEHSGLFIHERKIRKLYNPQQEEEDVNVLE